MSTSEIVERLEARSQRIKYEGSLGYYSPVDVGLDRAAAARLDELEADNAKMRAALQPFCDIIEAADGMVCDTCCIEVAQIRRAREALAGSGEK